MKKNLLTPLFFLLVSFIAYSQAELTVVAPSETGATTQVRAPNGLTTHTTIRGVIVIPASELTAIPSGTTISKLSFILSAASAVPAGGTIQYYLENSADVANLKSTDWPTIIAPMTSVYSGAFTLPTVAGSTGELALTTGFVYTGGSLYVAYDYLGSTFTTTPYTYSANNSLAGGWKGLATATTTPAVTLTGASSFRPCFRFTFANPFTNELNVTGVAGEKGIFNNTISQNQTVTSLISNTSAGTLTNIPVTLTITGANPYTTTQVIPSINAGQTLTLSFSNVPTVNIGSQVITISIPADQNLTNNSLTFNQEVQCNKISYAQGTVQSGAVGFNTGAGVIAVKHVVPNNIQTFVKTVSNYFPSTANIAGNTIKGLLFDTNGTKIDSTAVINITAGMLNTKQDFNFINGNINVAGQTVYVGFRQVANATNGYYPFANQNNSYVDPNAAATLPINGGVQAPLGSGLGYLMIEATFDYGGFNVTNSSPNGRICTNSTLNITPIPGYSNYEFIVNGSTVQNGPTATYTSGPLTATTTYSVIITNGSCTLSSNVSTINVGVEAGAIQITGTTDTAKTICVGEGTDDLIAAEFVNAGVLTGDNSIWVITDQVTGNIISTQISGPFNLESIPSGVYNIWYLSYVGDIGLATATNVSQLSGCFDLSNSIEVTTLSGTACSVLNTNDFSNDQNFKFYPNPTTSVLNIDYIGLKNLDLNISIQNVLGSKIFEKKYEKGLKNISLDFNLYTDGIYFVNITDNESGDTLIKKIIKN
jgi:hypothetical protein